MSDISIRTVGSFLNEDQRWLYGGKPDGPNLDIALLRSGFNLISTFPNGFIPSGISLAKATATGLYVPYVNDVAEAGTLTRTSTGGAIRLNIFTESGDGGLTDDIVATAAGFTAVVVQAAIRRLGGRFVTTTVTGADGGPLTVTFVGIGEDLDVAVDNHDATGGTVVWATTVPGGTENPAGAGTGKGLLFASVAYDRNSTANISAALCRDATVIESLLPSGHGVDAAFKLDNPHLKFI